MQGGSGGVQWQCPSCRTWNPMRAPACGGCEEKRPYTAYVQGPGRRGVRRAFTTVRPWSWTRVAAFFLLFAGLAVLVVGSYTEAFPAFAIVGGAMLVLGLAAASYDSGRLRGKRRATRPAHRTPAAEVARFPFGPAWTAGLLLGMAVVVLALAFLSGPLFLIVAFLSLILFVMGGAHAAFAAGLRRGLQSEG